MKPLPELLFDDQDNIDLENWDEYLDDIVCRCAKEAISAQYTHFSIQSLRQCYSGYRSEETYDKNGKSGNCVTTGGNPRFNQFLSCTGTGGQPCAGADLTNYVYSVANCKY